MKSKLNKVIATATLGVLAISPAMAYNETTANLKENRQLNIDIENTNTIIQSKPSSELAYLDYNSDVNTDKKVNYNSKNYGSDTKETSTITPSPTQKPTETPTQKPISTEKPTVKPTQKATVKPTSTPEPTVKSTKTPKPTEKPVKTVKPTVTPTVKPTVKPTEKPVKTAEPTEKPKTTSKPSSKKKKFTDSDVDLMAHLIYAEADMEGSKCQYYVGSVVLNRLESGKWGNTLHSVIYAKGQYACTWDGNIEKTPDEESYQIARDLLENGSVLPSKVIYSAEFIQNNVYCKIKNMYFCYD